MTLLEAMTVAGIDGKVQLADEIEYVVKNILNKGLPSKATNDDRWQPVLIPQVLEFKCSWDQDLSPLGYGIDLTPLHKGSWKVRCEEIVE